MTSSHTRLRALWPAMPLLMIAACSSSAKSASSTSATAAATGSVAATTANTPSLAAATTSSPAITIPATTIPATTAPPTTLPATTVPIATIPATSPPATVVAAAPAGDAFYRPPSPLPSGTPGTPIWLQPLAGIAGAKVSKVLYLSQADDGTAVAESATLVVPDTPQPAGGSTILSWAHGTTGSGDSCAPSKSDGTGFIPAIADLVAAGYVVVATDYQGLGTPGPHPYLDGESEGRAVLDAARAAQRIAGASNRVLAWGHSQGGQAVVWAGELAQSYAPDLDLIGVVAAAPAAHISPIAAAGTTKSIAGFWVPAMAGLAAAHPELSVADVMTADAITHLDVLESGCLGEYFSVFGGLASAPEKTNPMDLPAWNAVLTKNDGGQQSTAAPLFVAQGDQDTTVPQALNDIYTKAACAQGDTVDYHIYAGLTHTTVMVDPVPEMLSWMADRVAGKPAPNTCTP